MRVEALKIKMEIILLIKFTTQLMDCPLHHYQYISITKTQDAHHSKLQSVRVRASQMGSNTPCCSHSVAFVSQVSMGIMPMPWQTFSLEHSDGRQTAHAGPTSSLHNDGFFHDHVCNFRAMMLFIHCTPRKHIIKSRLE